MFQQLGVQLGIANNLAGLAGVAAARGMPALAARLLGAAEQLREVIAAPLNVPERADYERIMELARSDVDHATFEAARAEGRALPFDQAIAEAEQFIGTLAAAGHTVPS